MKILAMKQGSPEWHAARLGIPTASAFHRIVTPGGKLSEGSHAYLCELIAERLLNLPMDSASTDFMERGKALEEQAVAWYELQREVDTQRVGFVTSDDGRVGCSPDRLVGKDGGLEIKCPSAGIHVQYMLGGVAQKYAPQIQGALWLTGRAWWDSLSFHPDLEPALVRVERDEEYIAKLAEAIPAFCDRLDEATERLRALTGRAAA